MEGKEIVAFMTSHQRPEWAAAATVNLLNQTVKPSSVYCIFESFDDCAEMASIKPLFEAHNINLSILTTHRKGIATCKNIVLEKIYKECPDFDFLFMYTDDIFFSPNYIEILLDKHK